MVYLRVNLDGIRTVMSFTIINRKYVNNTWYYDLDCDKYEALYIAEHKIIANTIASNRHD